jgi:hypothetical protein
MLSNVPANGQRLTGKLFYRMVYFPRDIKFLSRALGNHRFRHMYKQDGFSDLI